MTFFAVIKDKIVYGIGTPEEADAWNDARNWSRNLKGMHCVRCSEAFYEFVLEYGGDFDFIEHSGTAYLLREWHQIVSELTGKQRAQNNAVSEVN